MTNQPIQSSSDSAVEVSYCIVATAGKNEFVRCLDAIAAEVGQLPYRCEVLVLDNATTDGCLEVAEDHPIVNQITRRDHRTGKAANDSLLLQTAHGRFCLLLNEDSELIPGATAKLHSALLADPSAGCAGPTIYDPSGKSVPSAWRFPSVRTALAQALFLHKTRVVQSIGTHTRIVDWAQSAVLLVRAEAAQAVDYLDEQFFVYSDETDLCKRMADIGWRTLFVPAAEAIHHEQLAYGSLPERRIIEFSRNRDRYMRKHHSYAETIVVRLLTAIPYLFRAGAATMLPGHNPQRYMLHVRATLIPSHGEGMREAAER